MILSNDVDVSEFITLTDKGVKVADFVQVRDALIRKFKEIYGTDIDLSTGTADGVYVNNLALIINNILQSFKNLYANLDVNSATGTYLDNLCALSNITRKPATKSNASLIITNTNSSPVSVPNMSFVDKAGTEWIYNKPISLAASGQTGDSISITVECAEEGKIEAEPGWIDKTLEVSYIEVSQPNAANVGEDEESDANLRARRAQSSGAAGVTVLDSLVGSLLQISGIRDCRIYANGSGSSQTAKDGTTIDQHEVYAILRYNEGTSVDDSIIGNLLYEKMTPGIYTIQTSDTTHGSQKSYNFVPTIEGSSLTLFGTTVYWKKAIPVNPTITIVLNTFDYFNTSEVEEIGKNLFDYINNLPVSTNLTEQNVLIETSYADPQFLGKNTYNVASVSITGASSGVYTNPDTYYKYTTIGTPTISGSTCTFTLS